MKLKGKFMKKTALLIAALLFAQASFAYYMEYETSDIKTLQGTGYSQEIMKIVETSRMLKQGVEKDYVPFFSPEFYSSNPIIKYYQMARRYWDPGSNSTDFGFKEINFANAFFDFSPSYNSKISPNNRFQRLFDNDIERLEYTGKIVKDSQGDEENAREIINNSQTENQQTLIEDL